MKNSTKKTLLPYVSMQQFLSYLGYHRRNAPDSLRKTALSMRTLALKTAKPHRIIALQNVSVRNNKVLFNGQAFHSKNLSYLLKDSQEAALFLVTLGGTITQSIKHLLEQEKPDEAYLLDKIASLLTERYADDTQAHIVQKRRHQSVCPTRRFSPGYGDWDVREQKKIFTLLQPEKIGVQLTRRFMMVPEKSISAIFGIRKEGKQ